MVKNAECVTDSRRAENQTVAFEEAAATCAPVMQGKGRMKRLLVIFCMWKTMRYARTSDGRAGAAITKCLPQKTATTHLCYHDPMSSIST